MVSNLGESQELRFSVLMSVYKNENPKYLDRALESIEKQTIIPNEIILVQDGPIPLELKKNIIKHKNNFKNEFKIIPLKKNHGLGEALRIGTNFVSNNWIARMDSDDISKPDRFEKQLMAIKKHKDIAVIGGQVCEFIQNEANIIGQRIVPTSSDELHRFLKWRNPFNHPTVMINKKVLQEVGGYKPFGNLEDYFLWARIISQGFKTCNLKDVLVLMRVDNGLYARRGKIGNVKYLLKLRRYLKKKKLINSWEQTVGNVILIINIIVPKSIRKVVYQRVLHKLNKSSI